MAKKRRKLNKSQAKEEAQRRDRQRQITWAVAGIVIVAVLAGLVLISLSGNQNQATANAEPLRGDIPTGVTAEGYPYRGDPEAPVTIVEYSDYNCPHCRDFTLENAAAVDDELLATGQAKYVVPPYALWQESVPVVEAAVCATEQGGFWDFHHLVFANQARFSTLQPPSRAMLNEWAQESGIDVATFDACLEEGRENTVLEVTQQAKSQLGVNGTPTFFVNGQKVQLLTTEAPIDTLRRAVEAALAADSTGQ
jgi:protein-disulfide isomerase